MDPAKLQAHLLSSLSTLPNVDPIHVTTLISAPRRVHDLYPHTPNPPRCFQLDYFLTLGVETDKVEEHGAIEQKQGRQEGRSVGGGKVESGEDAGGVNPDQTAGSQPSSAAVLATNATTGSQQADTRPKAKTHLLVSAIFAHLYIIPSLSQSILYISKVDSSSYGPPVPLPLTRTFVAAFISHFLLPPNRPTSTLRIQLFARSQGQYLFPNSVENPRKKASISGGRLCGWWKGVYEEAVRMAVSPSPAPASVSAASFSGGEAVNAGDTAALSGSLAEKKPPMEGERLNVEDVHLSYLLPSYSAHEAHCLLSNPKNPLPAGVAWSYEPPFPPKSTTPITGEMGKNVNIADLIPSLEDDPKQRFLDELALNNKPAETEIDGRTAKPVALSAREGESASSVSVPTAEGQAAASAPLRNVATDEPQKTHPRSLSNSNGHGHGGHGKRSYAQEQNAKEEEALRRTSHAALALTSYEEYWERLGFRQECAQDTTGFFSCVVGGPRLTPEVAADVGPTNDTPLGSAVGGSSVPAVVPRPADPTSRRFQLSPTIVERLHKALLNTDFINISLAQAGSAFWMDSMRRIVSDEIGAEGLKACTGTIEAKDPKVGAEEAAKRKADKVEAVTMLQPRKKKRG